MKAENSKTWSGRFNEPVAELVKRYTASVSFDQRLAEFDIQGSLAHARMLGAQGIISMVYGNEQAFCENEVYRNADQDKTLDQKLNVLTCGMIAVPLAPRRSRPSRIMPQPTPEPTLTNARWSPPTPHQHLF